MKVNRQQRARGFGARHSSRLFMPRSHESGEGPEAESESSEAVTGAASLHMFYGPAGCLRNNGQPGLFLIWDVFSLRHGRFRLAGT